jgi:hypothetical protein
MNNWTALTAKVVFLPWGRGINIATRFTDCKEPGGKGQRCKTGFLWIREAAIAVLSKKLEKLPSSREKWSDFDPSF